MIPPIYVRKNCMFLIKKCKERSIDAQDCMQKTAIITTTKTKTTTTTTDLTKTITT